MYGAEAIIDFLARVTIMVEFPKMETSPEGDVREDKKNALPPILENLRAEILDTPHPEDPNWRPAAPFPCDMEPIITNSWGVHDTEEGDGEPPSKVPRM